ncbi:N-acyl-D-amino-acid deacylase family protein [Phytohabitans kaempferiae]|uniref:Amidohydrolase family protein n=1 Tax=Phytohabitans kaempferiae TaxID=1620943 RepID=A0ABV6M522_9ACTN
MSRQLDLLITNGLVFDGTGRPGYRADVGVIGDEIALVGRAGDVPAARTVDATGKVVCPGFVDIHGHSDYLLLMDPSCDSKITQGITTDVGGNCGLSPGPFSDVWYVDWWVDNPRNFHSVPISEGRDILREHGLELDWQDLGGFFDRLDGAGLGPNYAGLVGHYVLRSTAYGEPGTQPARPATRDEIGKMKDLVRQAMEQGARGVSCAFHHTDPELDVPEEEFRELGRVVAEYDGVFAFHLRSYTDLLLSSVREAIELADTVGVRTTVSHLMADGKEYWGKLSYALDKIAKARAEGVPIWTDVMLTLQARNYMSGGLLTMMPDAAVAAAGDDWAGYFADSRHVAETAEAIRKGGANRWYKARFNPSSYWPLWDEMLRVIRSPRQPEFEGLMLYDVGRLLGCDSYEAMCHLLRINDGDADTILERSDEGDIVDVLQHPMSMVGTDGSPVLPIRSPRPPNPRLYASYPMLFGHYVRELDAVRFEDAVMKSTSIPAQFLGLRDRGELRPGYKADIVVMDAARVRGHQHLTARPKDYHEYSEGVTHVAVNGQLVVDGGEVTANRPGQVLRLR